MLVSDRHDNKNPDGEDELNDESVIGIALDATYPRRDLSEDAHVRLPGPPFLPPLLSPNQHLKGAKGHQLTHPGSF